MQHRSPSGETFGGFQLVVREETTRELVTELPSFDLRTVVLVHPSNRAVVLGSSQTISEENRSRCEVAGFSPHQRRSGGGAVVVDPQETIWIDLFLPVTDPLFVRDVRRGSYWVGDLWAHALEQIGYVASSTQTIAVHRGAVLKTAWSSQCCFAGVGPGELTDGDRKLMGLSQRRQRAGAWFFTLAYRSFDPQRDAHLLAPLTSDIAAVAQDLGNHVGTVDRPRVEVEQAVLKALSLFDA